MPGMQGKTMVQGHGQGIVLAADTGLSLWGGVDPLTGRVIDVHHPLHGTCITGKVLVLPGGRGSCTGSQSMLELLLNGTAPSAMVLQQPDDILALGVFVAEHLFQRTLPIVELSHSDWLALSRSTYARINSDGRVWCASTREELEEALPSEASSSNDSSNGTFPAKTVTIRDSTTGQYHQEEACRTLQLSDFDQALLDGKEGEAAKVAMEIVVRTAGVMGAERLIDVTQAHIDGCCYVGPGGLLFAKKLVELGGRVRVPTTLNSISIDRRRWKQLGVPDSLGVPAGALADAYVALGARPSYTCAPYLLSSAPSLGEQVVWGESNAVAYANSALGARTQKYADYLDICAALTGRAPLAGVHLDEARRATLVLNVNYPLRSLHTVQTSSPPSLPPSPSPSSSPPSKPASPDDSFWPVLGYLCGSRSGGSVPVVTGIPEGEMDSDALKAFSAAFATTAASPMFHIVGNTPEAPTLDAALTGLSRASDDIDVQDIPTQQLTSEDLVETWCKLDGQRGGLAGEGSSGEEDEVHLVSLGNPHFSATECAKLCALLRASKDDRESSSHHEREGARIWVGGREGNTEAKEIDDSGMGVVGKDEQNQKLIKAGVRVVLTMGRDELAKAEENGHTEPLREFGIEILTDTCWCMLDAPGTVKSPAAQ